MANNNGSIGLVALYRLLKAQFRSVSDEIALKTTTQVVLYSQLLQEVDAFADLIFCGHFNKKAKYLVALHLPNSMVYVLSLLALASRGMAFLPIPIDYPTERLLFVLKDANIRYMIMRKEDHNVLNLDGVAHRVEFTHCILNDTLVLIEVEGGRTVEKNRHDIAADDNTACDFRGCHTDDFAYVMYTSGSTGRPKGVKVKASSVVNLAQAQVSCWDIRPGDVIAQFASIGFDASISEIFTSLLSGASLAILNPVERHGCEFIKALRDMKVSMITLPPSALNVYAPSDLPCVKKVVSAGEVCTLSIAKKWTTNNNVRFFNAYGPTEATVCATCYEYIPDELKTDEAGTLPIGNAIDGVTVDIFDDSMMQVEPGVIGEIYIGGKGLSYGYIGHACMLNQATFVTMLRQQSTVTLYKTGDYAFQCPDGNIIYTGRKDDQVKIGGHRIDLGEIETMLGKHPQVKMAIVTVRRCANTREQSIAAFVAPKSVCISELREYMASIVPKYMIPKFVKTVDQTDFPKTLNGKYNRKRLDIDESVHRQTETSDRTYLNDTEILIANSWRKIFTFEKASTSMLHRQSSFSQLGGNSLQLVLLHKELDNLGFTNISFSDLCKNDTIQELADCILRKQREKRTLGQNERLREELREMILQDTKFDVSYCMDNAGVSRGKDRSQVKRTIPNSPYRQLNNVLISGTSGFLGAFLLSELMEQTHFHVYCMVRASTEDHGMGRIVDNISTYGLWKMEYSLRTTAVPSDLSQKRLGIAPETYKSLCETIDVIFMNAANMNFNTSYEDHRVVNVLGTKYVIEFATTSVRKYLFATSSLIVFLFPPEHMETTRRICSESEFFDDPLLIEGGYGQSKWASERLVMQALDFLPGGAIFRPARVSGRSSDGLGPKDDLFTRTLTGMKRLGAYPDMDFPYDLVPVDFCAKSMVQIALKICNSEPNEYQSVYHLFNRDTIPFRDLFQGMDLKPLPLSEWRQRLQQADESHIELVPLTPFFMSKFWDLAPNWPIFLTQNTDSEISDSVKRLMKPTKELLQTYKAFLEV